MTGTASYIQFPIFLDKGIHLNHSSQSVFMSFSTGFDFHADGRYFVLAERHKSKDMLGLYDASESYKLVRVSRCIISFAVL